MNISKMILLIYFEEVKPQQFSQVLQPCNQVPIQSEQEKYSDESSKTI